MSIGWEGRNSGYLRGSLSPSFQKYLLSAYNAAGDVLGTAEMVQIRQQCFTLLELIFLSEIDNKRSKLRNYIQSKGQGYGKEH